ncbi:biotin synthesis protein bioC [Vibrio variabilis]|uniref:Malonyl-[acyl-carrier protein] O-methyltransferase n=1 Tax=Vibrio variabilis TaxID=990271 RepID=A0ABQ0JKE3_9VIBR|nr:biotin synthesis protein bioC [Vibrio variabilis]
MSEVLANLTDHQANKVAISESFGRAAKQYDQHAELQRRVADRLLALLPSDLKGYRILDLGCGTGYCSQVLLERGAKVVCADLSSEMLSVAKSRCGSENVSYQVADAEALPFENSTFDIVISSLALQWCNDLAVPLGEMKRVTKPGGRVHFSTLLDGSLEELKRSWSKIDAYQHVNDFTSLNQVKIALAQSECIDHQLDLPKIVMWYETAFGLMKDLKGIGATHVEGRSKGCTSRRSLKKLELEYKRYENQNGLLPASYQICLGSVAL